MGGYNMLEKNNMSIPAWLTDFREQQWILFQTIGLPSRDSRWRQADLSFITRKNRAITKNKVATLTHHFSSDVIQKHRLSAESILLTFINGRFVADLSAQHQLPEGVIACSLREAISHHADLVKHYWPQATTSTQYPFANLNSAIFNDGLFLYIPDFCQLNMPVHLLSLVDAEDDFVTHPQHLIVLGKESKCVLLEEYKSTQAYMLNMVTTIHVGENAILEHHKIQQKHSQTAHLSHIFLYQQQYSQTNFINFSLGSLFARDELIAKLDGIGASCKTAGFYRLEQDHQYIDHQVDIEHRAPNTQSEMLYKGILDKQSRAVFNGKLTVAKQAQKISAYQSNHNLLLSNRAEVFSKPELEIYADDVKCKHGATIGQLDQDALFYMRSRGISDEDARHLLLQGFADAIIQQINHAAIKQYIKQRVCL